MYPGPNSRSRNRPHSEKSSVSPQPASLLHPLFAVFYSFGNCVLDGADVSRGGGQNLPLPGNTGGIFTGDLTYYAPGLGSCGITSSAEDMICAISWQLYGTSFRTVTCVSFS